MATWLAETGGENRATRANVVHALLHLLKARELRDREFVLLDGEREIGEAQR
ncbi:hypothetical protein FHR95_003199 [Halomonas fontilapidosi]|uniref:Uncharacterized protein n=1 Tax=Halomonas fontilapidosi TaxID=616675 RepID=A0A7W5DMG1_9GAMM|nr:hypothetical protein [Halomonas fontilapidosi]MBB3185609.1 hypothetical protein [Halomonas fontilapidosi]